MTFCSAAMLIVKKTVADQRLRPLCLRVNVSHRVADEAFEVLGREATLNTNPYLVSALQNKTLHQKIHCLDVQVNVDQEKKIFLFCPSYDCKGYLVHFGPDEESRYKFRSVFVFLALMSEETGLMPSPPPRTHSSHRKPEGRENIICQEGKDFHFQFVRAQVSDCVDDLLHACARHEQKLLLTLWCFVSHIPNFSVFLRKANCSI